MTPPKSEHTLERLNKNNMKKVIDKLFENYYYALLVFWPLESGFQGLWEA